MCEQIKENKKPAIIGGAVFTVILIIVIVLIVVLTGDSSDNDSKSSSNEGSSSSNDNSSSSSSSSVSNDTNILFIIIDDLGWTDISLHGSEYETPFLDSLIETGIELTNYYTHPVCTPTRASLLTGKYSWKLGMQDVQTMVPCNNEEIPVETPTAAELLSVLGFKTYYVGKWHLGYASWETSTPVGRGFDYGFGIFQGHGDFYSHALDVDVTDDFKLSGYDLFDMDTKEPYWAGEDAYSTDLFYNKSIEYLDYHSEGNMFENESFYMYLSWQTIHEPMQYEQDMNYATCHNISNPQRKIYCDKMLYLDEKLEDLIDWLKEKNLYDNTLIVVTTDNGGIVNYTSTVDPSILFMPHSDGCNYPYRAGKATLFEGGIKAIGFLTGEIIRKMGLNGTQFPSLTHSVDWFTTLIEGVGKKNTQYADDNVTTIAQSVGFENIQDTGAVDGLNLFDYFEINGNEASEEWTREYLYVNIDTHNGMGEKLNVSEYFDTIIYQNLNDESNTIWKYIRGHQLYWNYYFCNQSVYIDDETLGRSYEWLFNLTDNPYEYDEKNLVKLNFNDSNNNDTYQIMQSLISELDYQIYNGSYYDRQNLTTYLLQCLPICHNNTWTPFLDDLNDLSCPVLEWLVASDISLSDLQQAFDSFTS